MLAHPSFGKDPRTKSGAPSPLHRIEQITFELTCSMLRGMGGQDTAASRVRQGTASFIVHSAKQAEHGRGRLSK